MSNLQRPVVLLVEDSEDDQFFFQRALRKTGMPCSFFHVADGGQAVRYLEGALAVPDHPRNPRPDLVFLDLKLPTFSGFEILNWIRQHATTPPLEVVILSGSEDASDVARAISLSASSYLVKPISENELKSRLAAWAASQDNQAAGVSCAAGLTA